MPSQRQPVPKIQVIFNCRGANHRVDGHLSNLCEDFCLSADAMGIRQQLQKYLVNNSLGGIRPDEIVFKTDPKPSKSPDPEKVEKRAARTRDDVRAALAKAYQSTTTRKTI